MPPGDVQPGNAIPRDDIPRDDIPRDGIKATVGFEKPGQATDTPTKSLIRMLSARGNRQARDLVDVVGYHRKHAGIEAHVTPDVR